MNQQVNQNQPNNEPLIPQAQPGGIEDGIMEGTPNQIQIDKDFSEKVTNAIEESPNGDGNVEANSKEADTSESNNDTYEPAKEFTDFLNKEIAAGEPRNAPPPPNEGQEAPAKTADLSVLRDLLADNPHMAPAVKEALAQKGINLDASGDPEMMQRLDGMEGTISELTNLIRNGRDAHQSQQVHEEVNDMYLDVVKDVPKYGEALTNFFNNALLRDHPIKDIDREMLEGSHKAINSELNNYFNARLQAEGYSKSTGVPPSMNSQQGALTPPPSAEKKDYGNPNNRPANAFAEVDADFTRKVNNLFSQ